MSGLDDRLRRGMRSLASDIQPDADDLRVVHERAVVARRRARRAAVLGALAIVVLVGVGILGFGLGDRLGGAEPVAPSPSPTTSSHGSLTEIRNPFAIVRSINPASLGIDHPLKVAVAPDGHVYVSDRHEQITELTSTGRVVRRWGGLGTRPGRFRLYSGGLTVGPDGKVYVADTGNFRIQVFTPTGRFLAQYGGYGEGPGRFVWPSDIVVSPEGTIYVADDRAATITALSPTGAQLWRRGTPSEPDSNLVGHEHLGGVTSTGELVTANDDTGRVLYVDAAGRVVDSFSTDEAGAGVDVGGIPGGHFPRGTCGATLDPQGNVYVNSCEESYQPRHDTAVYDPQHHLIAAWKRGVLVDSPVFGPDGRAWAVTSGSRTLVELEVRLPRSGPGS